MHSLIRAALVTVLITVPAAGQIKFSPHQYKSGATTVDAELGEFQVPENRLRNDSKPITLRFIRFKSTAATPGFPIVYLAGGPGGSGIESARGTRFPLFMALREFGDVIAFDQRGTNQSGPDLSCSERFSADFGAPADRATAGAAMAEAVKKCAERLEKSGVDLKGYHTRESAADLEALRQQLGAKKLVLWGISYGTFLAQAMARDYPNSVDRMILAGIEGPDDTYKLPSDQQTLLEEIARLAAQQHVMPDLIGTLSRLLAELENPKKVMLTHPANGQTAAFAVGKFDLQLAVAQTLRGPDAFFVLPAFLDRLEQGDWMTLALEVFQYRSGNLPGSAMSIAVDCAAGATAGRRNAIADERKRTLLGDAINAPFPEICAGMPIPDAGDAYRAPLKSTIPALLISGTLDGRTRPRQGDELRITMPNAEHLIIEGAGHSDPLFLSTPKILEAMKGFMRGEKLRERWVTASEPLRFVAPQKVVTLTDAQLDRFVGTYRVDEKTTGRVVRAGSLLYTIRGNSQPRPIRPLSETEFYYPSGGFTVRFEAAADGRIAAMILRTPEGREQRYPREP